MKVNNIQDAEKYINENNPNGTKPQYLSHIPERIKNYPVNISYCADEKTGARFGNAACRKDKNPKRIGGGGRNSSSKSAWQLWIWDI